ncbi:MAG TPA: response regulator transcription factor [Spirochaetia bacterium]|nr:response regulator transcription factor [Spirochaetia bacterium]
MTVRILIADDHPLVREGLCRVLAAEPALEVIGEAEDGRGAIDFVREYEVDIVLLDINMPGINGIEACKVIKKERPLVGVVALTVHDQEEYVFELIKAGISGYVLKDISPDLLVRTILGVARGESFIPPLLTTRVLEEFSRLAQYQQREVNPFGLTGRETEILRLVGEGRSNREIAGQLFISERTVKNHLTSVFGKLGVSDRTRAALYAVKNRLVEI